MTAVADGTTASGTAGEAVAAAVASTSSASGSGASNLASGSTYSGAGNGNGEGEVGEPGGKKKKATKRRKVNHACLYCRRSHMTCDEGRPCQRCIKREIGHLCHDEQRPKSDRSHSTSTSTTNDTNNTNHGTATTQPAVGQPVTTTLPGMVGVNPYGVGMSMYQPITASTSTASTAPASTSTSTSSAWPSMSLATQPGQPSFYYGPETLGNEFSVLTDFLETLEESTFFSGAPTTTVPPSLMFGGYTLPTPTTATSTNPAVLTATTANGATGVGVGATSTATPESGSDSSHPTPSSEEDKEPVVKQEEPPPIPFTTKTEKFLLTAADQESGLSRDERLSRVIRSKYEAGLLKPYNYVKGYARLSRWMERNVSQDSKQQILQPLSVLRPKFRAVAQSLRDIDLVFIEEAFERLLLDYDRVFSAMGVPACLWRRTGEIYKGNREFSQLVGVDGYLMREGRLCIYELMAEESAVNYWEKYGNVAFDSSQKAVLTSCVLRYKPTLNLGPNGTYGSGTTAATSGTVGAGPGGTGPPRVSGYPAPMMPPANSNALTTANKENAAVGAGAGVEGGETDEAIKEAGLINCCFSFTIRRDKWGIPSMIVGNFIRC